ncbi:MAG: hypothetical protein DRJ61_06170 [Acidobacteria bacterium]|nr:MAG: hypothetical protein DRJ61_06170 [Acidobacteriota bacterium]
MKDEAYSAARAARAMVTTARPTIDNLSLLQNSRYQGLLYRRHLACDFHRNHNVEKQQLYACWKHATTTVPLFECGLSEFLQAPELIANS